MSEQKARSSSSWSGADDDRLLAAPAEGAERERLPRRAAGARPGQRPEADAGAVVEAQRREQPAQAHAGVGDRRRVARGRLPAHHDEQVRAARAGRPEGVRRSVLGEGVALHERQPLAERHLGRGDLDAQQRRDDDGLGAPVVERGLDLGVGALEALGAQREVGRLLEDAAEEDAQGELGAGARLGGVAALAARLEVVAQAAQPRERVHGGQEARQPREQADALLDEVRRQRAVAVQRAVAAPAAHDLEGDLGAVGGLGGELPGGLLDEGGQGAMELAVVHGRAVRRGRGAVLPRARRLAAGGPSAALTASTEARVRDSRPCVTL